MGPKLQRFNVIIFGTRGVTYSAGQGQFHCPRCRGEQGYNQRRVRRFFTLYFIPCIPLDVLGEYVECSRCKSTWDPAVLEVDPKAETKAFEAAFERAVRRVLVMMVLADGKVEPEELQTLREIYEKITGVQLGQGGLEKELAEAEKDGQDVEKHLGRFVGQLNDAGKEMVVKAAMAVAAADGEVAPEEQALLLDIARALQMSEAHVRGVLAA